MPPSADKAALHRTVTIVNELGMHARSAAKVAKLAREAAACVWLRRDAEEVDATSVIDILTLACAKGSQITIAIENPVDRPVLEGLVRLVEDGFGE